MSTSVNIRAKFEEAYIERKSNLARGQRQTPEVKNKAEYGQGYYQDKLRNMSEGYQHPYHSERNPLVFCHYHYMKTLFEAVGPEQVSPHYESLSRSRRGLIFLSAYIGSITTLTQIGGWSHNEWLRGLLYHHEYLLAFYLGFMETRHFSFMLGPKFTLFYNVYSRYETSQLFQQWADSVEEQQMEHLRHSKEQMEYIRINKEYDFVKKRALINFLTNSRLDAEQHFHSRAHNMLKQITYYENNNLKNLLRDIGKGSIDKVNAALNDAAQSEQIKEQAFQSALAGIRKGSMTYENDPLLPILTEEVMSRTSAYQSLSAEEESAMLSLTADQKRIVVDQDRKAKQEFLTATPNINNAAVKAHEKYREYAQRVAKA
jgi:hypothetical protein